MTALADCLVSTKVLFSDHTFFPSVYLFVTNKCNCVSLLREGYKNEDFFSILTMIYPKTNMNVVKTISPRQ